MFAVGILPALLAVVVITRLNEPEKWQKSVAVDGQHKQRAGSVRELFGVPRWRKNVIVGMLLALSGVIGLWGIGFFSIDLNQSVFRKIAEQRYRDEGDAEKDRAFCGRSSARRELLERGADETSRRRDLLSLDASNRDRQSLYDAAIALRKESKPVSAEAVLAYLDQPGESRPAQSAEDRRRRAEYLEGDRRRAQIDSRRNSNASLSAQAEIKGEVGELGGMTSMLFNIGAFFGIYAFSRVTQRIGRRPTFAMFFFAAFVSTAIAFLFMDNAVDVFWMVPMMGFCQLSVFGGYAIYFPELFPTHLRSTGTSFCYNIGRFVAAPGPSGAGLLDQRRLQGLRRADALRGRDDVLDLPPGDRRGLLRPRDEGPAAAGVATGQSRRGWKSLSFQRRVARPVSARPENEGRGVVAAYHALRWKLRDVPPCAFVPQGGPPRGES